MMTYSVFTPQFFRRDLSRQELVNWKGRRSNRLGKGRLKLAEKKIEEVN